MSLQVHAWRAQNNFSTSVTNYITPINGQFFDATEHRGTCICTAGGTFSNWVVTLPTAPGVGNTETFTLRVNGVDTAAVIAINGTNTSGQYTSPITLADGDEVTFKCVPNSSPTVSAPSFAWDFTSTTTGESIYGGGNVQGPIAISRTNRFLSFVDTVNWDGGSSRDVVSLNATINKYTVKLDVDAGASGTITFRINKNGVAQDGSGGTPDTRLVFNNTGTKKTATFSLTTAPGDTLTFSAIESGTANTVRPIFGAKITATTPGQSHYGAALAANLVTGSTQYAFPMGGQTLAPSATESARSVTLGLTGLILSNLRVVLTLAPGGGSQYVFDTRKNAASGSNSVTIADAATTGSNSSSTTFAAGDTVDIEVVPSGTPLARQGGWAWMQDQSPSERHGYMWGTIIGL